MVHIGNCMANVEPGAASNRASLGLPSDLVRLSTDLFRRLSQRLTALPKRARLVSPDEKPSTWRMKPQPASSQQTRYHFFPRQRQLPVLNSNEALDLEKASTWSVTDNEDKTEKPNASSLLKANINQHSIVRRRKVSVPDLGPMTTVQEVSVDSRTLWEIYALDSPS